MTSNTLLRKQTANRQIIIQDEKEQTSVIHEQLQYQQQHSNQKNQDTAKLSKEKPSSGLKINKDKLLHYESLKERNRQVEIKKQMDHKNAIANNALNKSNSIKMLKYIKHKVEICSKRSKNPSEKENDSNRFLPKMPSKLLRQSAKCMNKTVSSISFSHQRYDKSTKLEESKESNLTFSKLRLKTQSQLHITHPSTQKMVDEGLRLNSNRSSSKMSRSNFNKTSSLSKFRTSNLNTSQISYSHNQIMSILSNMTEKQGQLLEQKKGLQQRIAALKDGIQKEHTLMIEIAKNKQRMASFMVKKEHQSRTSLSGAKLSKKKNENFQTQTKDLQQKLYQTSNTNNKVLQVIEQEKDLIRMYEVVIQQVKNQLKIQKREKAQLQKKLAILKKNEKSLHSKLYNQQTTNQEILRKVYVSLQKWS